MACVLSPQALSLRVCGGHELTGDVDEEWERASECVSEWLLATRDLGIPHLGTEVQRYRGTLASKGMYSAIWESRADSSLARLGPCLPHISHHPGPPVDCQF